MMCADICSLKGCAAASCRTYRKVMQEASLLGNVIRLVDYMLVEGTVERAIITVEELLSTLEAPRTSQDKMQKVDCAACCTHGVSRTRPAPQHGCSAPCRGCSRHLLPLALHSLVLQSVIKHMYAASRQTTSFWMCRRLPGVLKGNSFAWSIDNCVNAARQATSASPRQIAHSWSCNI